LATVGPLEWPQKAIFVLPDADRWPKPRTLKALPQPAPATTGKRPVKPVSVDGRKYSQRGGYSSNLVGPGLHPKLAAALVEAANYLLASSTWRSYASVLKKVGRVAEETGVKFRLPMTTVMVRTLVGALIKSGLKSGTIISYMSSVKYAHKLSGADPSTLEDEVVQAAVKNRESLTPVARSVMSLKMMSRAHSNLRKLKITSRRKRTIWATMVFMFMGSLRGSEIITLEKKKFDPAKKNDGLRPKGCKN
jgi:site-specific recombinase XerD